MKISNEHLINSAPAWQALAAMDLRAKDSFKILRHYNTEVMDTIKAATEANQKLFQKYGEDAGLGNGSIVVKETTRGFKAFQKQQKELLSEEIDVKVFPDTLEAIINRSGGQSILSAQQIVALEPFFKEPEEKATKGK